MSDVKRAGDVNYIPAWQIRGAYSPPDSLRDLEYEKALSEERGTAGLTTSSTVSIPKPDGKDKEESMDYEEAANAAIDFMDEDELNEEPEEARFRIEDDQTAEWALQKIREAEAEKAKWKEFYDKRYQMVCNKCDLTIANMKSLLQSYFDTVPHKVTKTEENYPLPSGKIMIKRKAPSFDYRDSVFVDWLKTNAPAYVKTVETPDWARFKNTLAKDEKGNFMTAETENGLMAVDGYGEVIPLAVTLNAPEFTYQLNKEEEA